MNYVTFRIVTAHVNLPVYKANLIFIGYLLNDFSFVFPFALK